MQRSIRYRMVLVHMSSKHNTLSREDWILAGFRSLASAGISALRAEKLARSIGTTKGSFYWHFRDVADFQSAMLAYWRIKATDEVISKAGALGSQPRQDLYALVDSLSELQGETNDGVRAEAALRQWAATDEAVFQAVQSVDRTRLRHLASLLAGSGLAEANARATAEVLYGALIGLQHLELMTLVETRKSLLSLLTLIVGPEPR